MADRDAVPEALFEPVPEGDMLFEPLAVADAVPETEKDAVPEGEPGVLCEPVGDALVETVSVDEPLRDGVALVDGEAAPEADSEFVALCEKLLDEEPVAESEPGALRVPVGDVLAETVSVGEPLRDGVALVDGEAVPEADSEFVALCEKLLDEEAVAEGVGIDGKALCDTVCEELTVPLREPEPVAEPLGEAVSEAVADVDVDGEAVAVPLSDGEGVPDPLLDAVSEAVAEGEDDCVTALLALCDAEGEAD